MRFRRMIGMTTASLVLVGLAGCGSDDDDGAATTAPPSASTTLQATTAPTDATSEPSSTAPQTSTASTAAPSTSTEGTTAAAGAEWDEIVAAAQDEGKVTLYTSVPGSGDRLKPVFEEKYGITLEFSFLGPDQLTKLEAERDSNLEGGDVSLQPTVSWFESNEMLPLTAPELANWDDKYIKGNYFIANLTSFGIAYNTNLVSEEVNTYEDVLAVDGPIGTVDAVSAATTAWYKWLEDTLGEQYLVDLAAKQPTFYSGSTPVGQALAAGEIAATPYMPLSVLAPLISQGAPVKVNVPDPAYTVAYGAAAVSWSHHPNAAQVLMNFIASEEGQALVVGPDETNISPLPNIPGSLPLSDNLYLFDQPAWTPEVHDAYLAHWKGVFGR